MLGLRDGVPARAGRDYGGVVKALLCTVCMDVRGLPNSGDVKRWVECDCGNARARWRDALVGTVEVDASSREDVRVLGLNNHYLLPAVAARTHEQRRELHDAATDAPNHIFDKSRAACWAVVFRVGETTDVSWFQEKETE